MAKKKVKDRDFYINEIEVDKWLDNTTTEDTFQTHRFANRIEHKKNYKLHREDGPAVEYNNGNTEYYLNGEFYRDEEYNNWLISKRLEKMLS